jgi:hypothetical protein
MDPMLQQYLMALMSQNKRTGVMTTPQEPAEYPPAAEDPYYQGYLSRQAMEEATQARQGQMQPMQQPAGPGYFNPRTAEAGAIDPRVQQYLGQKYQQPGFEQPGFEMGELTPMGPGGAVADVLSAPRTAPRLTMPDNYQRPPDVPSSPWDAPAMIPGGMEDLAPGVAEPFGAGAEAAGPASTSESDRTRDILRQLRFAQADKDFSRAGALMSTTAGAILLGQNREIPEVDAESDYLTRLGVQGSLEAQDPDSEISKRYQDYLRQATGIEAKAPASAIQSTFGDLVSGVGRGQAMAFREQTRQEDLSRDDAKDRRNRVSQERIGLLGDETINEANRFLEQARSVGVLADTNAISAQAAIVGIAKASRDTGVLSDQDIARWSRRAGIPGAIDKIEQFFTGMPSGEVLAQIKTTAIELGRELEDAIARRTAKRRDSFSRVNPDIEADAVEGIYGQAGGKPEAQGKIDYIKIINQATGEKRKMPRANAGKPLPSGWALSDER